MIDILSRATVMQRMEAWRNGLFMGWVQTIRGTVSSIEWKFIVGFLLLLLYYLIKGTAKEKVFFVVQSVVYIVLVLNPVSCEMLHQLVGEHFAVRVYRFFWAFPIYFAYAYFFTKLLVRMRKYVIVKGMVLVASVGVVLAGINQIIVGSQHTFGSTGILTPVENAYKIDNDVIEAADMIDEDKGGKSVFANVISDSNVDMELRAYNASLLKLNTDAYFNIYTSDLTQMPLEELKNIMEEMQADYIIISCQNPNIVELDACGYKIIGATSDTENPYYVYRIKESS